MSTRCHIEFRSGDVRRTVYRHWDGYPSAVMEDLLACAPLQRVVKEEGRGSETEAEHDRENQTELRQQAHGRPPRPTRRGTLSRWENPGGKAQKLAGRI